MAVLSLNNSEIVRAILQVMGAGRNSGDMDTATEADVRNIIRDGLRRFYFPTVGEFVYQWRWREKHHPIPIDAKFTTGTIAVAAGTITLTGGIWPAWLADGFVIVSGHVLFVTVRNSDTVLTTSNSALAVTAGAKYEAFRYRYALPSDFAEWLGGVVYADGSDSWTLAGTSEAELRLRYAVQQKTNDRTTHYAIASTHAADAMRISFWPVPQPNAFIQGVYLSVPDDNLPADLKTPGVTVQVPPLYAKAAVEAILAEAENYMTKLDGQHESRFQEALQQAIAHDKAVGGAYDFDRPIDPDFRGLGLPPTSITFPS